MDGTLLLTAAQMAALDARTIAELGVPSLVLMECAAWACCEELLERFPERLASGVVVLAGPGNNGADGLAMARRLHLLGVPVRVRLLPGAGASGDGARQVTMARAAGVPMVPVAEGRPADHGAGVLVDAVFGTGLARPVGGLFAAELRAWAGRAPVLAVDIPSGIDGSTGQDLGASLPADVTVTFATLKVGHAVEPGRSLCGRLIRADIGVPPQLFSSIGLVARLTGPGALRLAAPRGEPRSHKGSFGHLLVVAGGPGKTGAAALTCAAALRAGAGLVTLALPDGLVAPPLPVEVMVERLPSERGWLDGSSVSAVLGLLATRDALALGPGLGTAPETVAAAVRLHCHVRDPAVVDADALNALASEGPGEAGGPRVLTPHPGELRRLQPDGPTGRLEQVRHLARDTGCVALLKGAATLVADPEGATWINPSGNPGMATAGSGDVLTGVVGALLARGCDPLLAARAAAWWHGRAGDRAAERGQPSVVASDLIDELGGAWLDAHAGMDPPFASRPAEARR